MDLGQQGVGRNDDETTLLSYLFLTRSNCQY